MTPSAVLRPCLTLLSASVLSLAVACSPLPLLNAVIPANGYRLSADIPYGDQARHKLDVYVPRKLPEGERRPVVVFFYGGKWRAGDRADYRFVAESLSSQGFITVVPDYRLYPEVRFPDFVHDAAAAVRWTKTHITRYGGDASRLFIMGHSAGAHIAALLALDHSYLKRVGMRSQELRGMIGLAGPYDFLPIVDETVKAVFGPEEGLDRSQPIHHVSGDNPPLLLLVGKKDTVVRPGNTTRLAARVRAAGGPVRVIEFPGYDHAEMVAKLAAPLRGNGDLLKAVSEFVNGPGQLDQKP